MLSGYRGLSAQHIQAVLESLQRLCQKPWATSMTVLVIAITLVLPAFFGVMADNLGQLTQHWQKEGRIALYLKSPSSPTDETSLLSRVQSIEGVGEATFKSSSEGLTELEQQEGMQDIRHYLPENPLPGVIEVTPALSIHTPEQLRQLLGVLKTIPGVEQAKLDLDLMDRLHAIFRLSATVAEGFILLLAMAVVLIIGNTLRLSFHSRHEEIKLLKLIGAKDSYIARPFLYTGIFYGLSGAAVAVILLNAVLLSLKFAVHDLAVVYGVSYSLIGVSLQQVVILVVCSTFLGWLGAWGSVKRQLSAIDH